MISRFFILLIIITILKIDFVFCEVLTNELKPSLIKNIYLPKNLIFVTDGKLSSIQKKNLDLWKKMNPEYQIYLSNSTAE